VTQGPRAACAVHAQAGWSDLLGGPFGRRCLPPQPTNMVVVASHDMPIFPFLNPPPLPSLTAVEGFRLWPAPSHGPNTLPSLGSTTAILPGLCRCAREQVVLGQGGGRPHIGQTVCWPMSAMGILCVGNMCPCRLHQGQARAVMRPTVGCRPYTPSAGVHMLAFADGLGVISALRGIATCGEHAKWIRAGEDQGWRWPFCPVRRT